MSPTGNAMLVAVAIALPPVRSKMRWKANAAHNDDAPSPATTPSSQFGRDNRPRPLWSSKTVAT